MVTGHGFTRRGKSTEILTYNFRMFTPPHFNLNQSRFFQNEAIFVELDELDELDRITHARIGLNYSHTQAQKTLLCNG